MAPSSKPQQRLAYIDLMRGIACLLMFGRHTYDSWLGAADRAGDFYRWSAFLSTMAAPSFLFLAGTSTVLAIESQERRGATAKTASLRVIRRGFVVLLWGLALHLQGILMDWPGAPKSDALRVDVLNVIGVSIMFAGVICWAAKSSRARAAAALATTVVISMATPMVWTTRFSWLPWYLESYINGVHDLGVPQPHLFPIFPWSAFCTAGLIFGLVLLKPSVREQERATMVMLPVAALVLGAVAWAADHSSVSLYRTYDYWHTSPNFFLMRGGVLLLMVAASYGAARLWAGNWLIGRLVVLGQSSLLVYWVHIGLVYGRLSILPRQKSSVPLATLGLFIITVAMMALAAAQPWLVERRKQISSRLWPDAASPGT